MCSKQVWRRNCICLLVLMLLALMTSCAGKEVKSERETAGPAEPKVAADAQLDPPLAKPYRTIVVARIETTAEIAKDYPNASREAQTSAILGLEDNKFYQDVKSGRDDANYSDGTLLVKARITDMRIVSTGARIWVGAFAGSSYMEINLTLVDAATNTVVREKKLSSNNNPWAAAWVGWSSDHSLPTDMGRVLAAYVNSVVPKSTAVK